MQYLTFLFENNYSTYCTIIKIGCFHGWRNQFPLFIFTKNQVLHQADMIDLLYYATWST
jgi:hypothetical protein